MCAEATTLDDLIKALDDAVSGPADKDRSCMRELLLPEARLSPIGKRPDRMYAPHILTLDDWIEAVRKHGHDVLTEHQVKVKVETYGHLAHLWSTYELRLQPDGPPTGRGINSIQAVFLTASAGGCPRFSGRPRPPICRSRKSICRNHAA